MKPKYRFSMAALVLCGSLVSGLAQAPSATGGDGGQGSAPVDRHGPGGPIGQSGPNGQANPHNGMHHGPGMDPTFGMLPPGTWWKTPEIVQQVGLTPDQVKRIDDIFEKSRMHLMDLKTNLDKQTMQLEPLLNANPVDQARAAAQIDRVADARADLEKANAKMLLGMRAVLTTDQWTKLQNHPDRGGFGEPHRPVNSGPGGV